MAQARPWPPGRWPVSDRHAWLHLQPVPMAGRQVPFRFASWLLCPSVRLPNKPPYPNFSASASHTSQPDTQFDKDLRGEGRC